MSIKPYPSNTHEFDFSNLDFTNDTGIVEHPQDWIIYTYPDTNNNNKSIFTLCIDYIVRYLSIMIFIYYDIYFFIKIEKNR